MSLALAFMLAASSTNPQTCEASVLKKIPSVLNRKNGFSIGGVDFKREDIWYIDVLKDSASNDAAIEVILTTKGQEKLAKVQKGRSGQTLSVFAGRTASFCLTVNTEKPVQNFYLTENVTKKNVFDVYNGIYRGLGSRYGEGPSSAN
jgi:hypothetical protein